MGENGGVTGLKLRNVKLTTSGCLPPRPCSSPSA